MPTGEVVPLPESGSAAVSTWYVRIVEWMLQHPGGRLQQCAADLSASAGWLAIVVKSDGFRNYFRIRHEEHSSSLPLSSPRSTHDRLQSLADVALDALAERVENGYRTMPIDLLQSAADMALKNLGYNRPSSPGFSRSPVQVNVVVGKDVLDRARQNLAVRMALADPENNDIEGEVAR